MFVDTSFCVDLLRESRKSVEGPATRKLKELGDTTLQMSIFVSCELHAGAQLSSKPAEETKRVDRLTEFVEVILPDKTFAVSDGEAEAFLRRKGKGGSTMDLLIGVTAKVHGKPLLTRNVDHFLSIPGLMVETY